MADAPEEHELKARDNRREYDDLVAQRRSALWTMIMGIAALTGMALSAIGVLLVKQTFDETRRTNRIAMRENARATRRAIASAKDTERALRIARREAKAAEDQIKASERTAKRQLRAYVGSKSGRVTENQCAGAFKFRNFGATPAIRAQYIVCYGWSAYNENTGGASQPDTWLQPSSGTRIDLLPGGEVTRTIAFPAELLTHIPQFEAGNEALWAKVEVSYSDVFNVRYSRTLIFWTCGAEFTGRVFHYGPNQSDEIAEEA